MAAAGVEVSVPLLALSLNMLCKFLASFPLCIARKNKCTLCSIFWVALLNSESAGVGDGDEEIIIPLGKMNIYQLLW